MILSFEKRFASMVEDGSKRQTIRKGRRWKVGDRADLYTGGYSPATFAYVRVDGDAGCICLGDGLMGAPCDVTRHARYEKRQTGGRTLLFRAVVTEVEWLSIARVPGGEVACVVGYRSLTVGERERLAQQDGFEGNNFGHFAQMFEYLGSPVAFVGQIIRWDYDRRFMELPNERRGAK